MDANKIFSSGVSSIVGKNGPAYPILKEIITSVKENNLSAKVCKMLKERDWRIWDFVTAKTSLQRGISAARLGVSRIRQHNVLVSKELGDELKSGSALLNEETLANRRMLTHLRKHAKATSVYGHLMQMIRVVSSERNWENARKYSDFSKVENSFEKLVAFTRNLGSARAKQIGLISPYDALMDELSPGLRTKDLTPLVADIEAFTKNIVPLIKDKQKSVTDVPEETWNMDLCTQKKLVKAISGYMGFKGELGEAAHPLCLGDKDDVRITISYNEKDFISSAVMYAVHETGHALYRMNLPEMNKDHLVSNISSQAMDETMSLFMQNQVGRSKEFAVFLDKVLKEDLGVDNPNITPETIFNKMNKVKDGTLRMPADEVNYPLHLILRYKLGRELIDGNLMVKDLPKEWNKQTKELLGTDVKNDADGCLQDIHWFSGQIGYFPNYFYGTLASAQLMEKAKKDNPNILSALNGKSFVPIVEWLTANVYTKASLLDANDIIKSVTGKPLSAEAHKNNIKNRYLDGDIKREMFITKRNLNSSNR